MKKLFQLIVIIGVMMLSNLKSYGQASSTNHAYSGGEWVGWSSTTQSLDFGFGAGPTFTMRLIPTTGDLNLVNGVTGNKNSYQIGGSAILWHNGNPNNIFVGVGAGNSSTTTINYNTFVGRDEDDPRRGSKPLRGFLICPLCVELTPTIPPLGADGEHI
jgi:hypothetical protein